MACTGCGLELSPSFSFCPQCGRPQASARAKVVEPPPRQWETDRRQVTVLFADLSGFTGLSERLDAEDVRAFQAALFDAFTQATLRHGGFVNKFVGDAVLAVFGAPVAHEDDPERALHTALDMLARARALSAEWQARLGQPVNLHIAVHTGPVVAGSLGHGASAAYEVTGDTVNTASRLLGTAAAATILVSGATHALTRHRFAFEPAGEAALRGKTQTVAIHRLLGPLVEPRSARGLAAHGLTAPMVGRAAELGSLIEAFGRVTAGRAEVVSVVGEAGTGKSRLIAEFLARLESDGRLSGMNVRRVICSSLGEPTYGVFGALFREGYDVQPDDALDVARRKLASGLRALGAEADVVEAIAPMLGYVLGVDDMRPHHLDPEQLKRQIMMAARLLVEQRLRQGPLLTIIDDAHWADMASLELLQDVADHLADRPLMVVVSHRPEATPFAVTRAGHSVLRLAPLSLEGTEALMAGLFGNIDADIAAQLQTLVATRAGGNPLFIEEILRSLVSTGVLVRDGDRWTCAAPCEVLDVPATLQGLLLSRIDSLPAEARRLLQDAAVLGAVFDDWLLRAVIADPHAADAALGDLIAADLLQPVAVEGGQNQYRFAHALVRDAVYQNQLLARRTELHERAGRALESVSGAHPERLSHLEALGHHWSLSADKARGARYLTAAGDWARGLYANEDAIRHYRRALRTLAGSGAGVDQARVIRERLADLLALTGCRAEALADYQAVHGELEEFGDGAATARLQRKIGRLHWEAGDRQRASACFTAGLAQLGDDGPPIERAQLFQEMGRLAFRAGDNAGAITWAERALAEAARADGTRDDPEQTREAAATRAQAYNTLGVALARTGRLEDAVDRIERSLGLAEQHDLLQAACRGYTNLGVLYSSLDPPRSIATCLRGLEMAKKVGDLGFQSHLYANLAVAYCALTDRCEAEGMVAAQTAANLDRRLGLLDHLAVPLIVLGQIHQCHGDHEPAFAYYREALAVAERIGEPQLLFPCYDGLATLHLDAGDQAQAEAYLAKSQEVCEGAGIKPDALMVLPFLC